jgi:hypothetical protein
MLGRKLFFSLFTGIVLFFEFSISLGRREINRSFSLYGHFRLFVVTFIFLIRCHVHIRCMVIFVFRIACYQSFFVMNIFRCMVILYFVIRCMVIFVYSLSRSYSLFVVTFIFVVWSFRISYCLLWSLPLFWTFLDQFFVSFCQNYDNTIFSYYYSKNEYKSWLNNENNWIISLFSFVHFFTEGLVRWFRSSSETGKMCF